MRSSISALVILFCVFASPGILHAGDAAPICVKIGVLANRGVPEGKQRWQPTADFLTAAISGYEFEAVPLDFDDVLVAVARADVDFVVANSGMYVTMEVEHGVARIAMLKNRRQGVVCKQFGGVIFTRADRTDIREIADLKGKSFMAVDEHSLGGWQMAWREIKERGLDPYRDFSRLEFGGIHDSVVVAVRDGKVDAGTVRTDLFERIAAQGHMDPAIFRVLQPQVKTADFPFVRSTRLYPEWPIAKLRHTSDELSQRVAIALLQMPGDAPAAKAAECVGWTVPLDYTTVHECLKIIGARPYENYGRVTPAQVLSQYGYWLAGGSVALVLCAAVAAFVMRLNRGLDRLRKSLETELAVRRQAEQSLQQARAELETRVNERTTDLAVANAGLLNEIEERKRAEQAHARFVAILEATTDIVGMAELDHRVLYFNGAARKLLNISPNENVALLRLEDCHPDWARKVLIEEALPAALRTGVWMGESAFRTRDGREIPVSQVLIVHRDPQGKAEYLSTIARDLSERLKLEAQVRQAQKMEAVGRLAGGVAHDFNNLLSIILGCGDMLAIRGGLNADMHGDLGIIRDAVQRGASLTRQLLAVSRSRTLAPSVLDLNAVVAAMDPMLRRTLGEHIAFTTEFAPDLKTVKADPGQLEQVILNLCINARDAMAAGGKLSIRTANAASEPAGLPPGQYVTLTVSDTGCGIEPEIQHRVFEPFFTTKEPGKGSGLGLSTVYGIVRQSGGTVLLSSQPGHGSTFTVYLPGSNQSAVAPAVSAAAVPVGVGATVLLAEDEAAVRSTTARYLCARGYIVLEARDGASALKISEEFPGTIELLITDMVMPGMDGRELIRRLREKRPAVKVLCYTGYMPDSRSEDLQNSETRLVQKPCTPSDLELTVRELLNSPRSQRS